MARAKSIRSRRNPTPTNGRAGNGLAHAIPRDCSAAGSLAGLGLKIRDALTLIGLALSGDAGVFGYRAGRRGRGHEGL